VNRLTRHTSGGPWEERYGYSRAVRVGDEILVSGSTAVIDAVVQHPGDAAAQARVAFGTAVRAVEELGGAVDDIVRTRMYLVDRAHCDAVGAVHGEVFAGTRPAATMILVAGLIDDEMLVEVEIEARVGAGSRSR
jgi:enamine deaminase RidA (YjgF/YER057c/UK114 family)